MRLHIPAQHHKMKLQIRAMVSDAVEDEETLEPDEDADLVLRATHHRMHSYSTLRDTL
jgi:hypothetical protein